jgi:hypothetical protein
LREYDSKISKEADEQKKSRELAGLNTPRDTGGSDDSKVVIVYGSAKKRQFKIFTRENSGKKSMGGGMRKELIRWKVW